MNLKQNPVDQHVIEMKLTDFVHYLIAIVDLLPVNSIDLDFVVAAVENFL